MTRNPLPVLLSLYEQYGPVFSLRALHQRMVWMIGPAANHFITVTDPQHFHWREGHFGDLTPLLGDGILTTDGAYHDRARRIMMPAFHRERIEAAVAVMVDETVTSSRDWRAGDVVDIYAWTRRLALRIAMRALLGLDPDQDGEGDRAAQHFEQALAFYGIDAPARVLRGPGTPWRRMRLARRRLDAIVLGEIDRRRRLPAGGGDVLSMLVAATDEQGHGFSDEEIRDQLVTLMFAGHDTSTSTIAFLLYELHRHPDVLLELRVEQDAVLGDELPTSAHLSGQALVKQEQAIDEALRLYPPVWIGARRAVTSFEFAGRHVPAGSYVHYSPWATHHLPHIYDDPETFRPERMAAERKAALPRGAYVPFGGGSRICIGKRFGQTVVRAVVTTLLARHDLELLPGYELRLALAPTLKPRAGLPMRVGPRV